MHDNEYLYKKKKRAYLYYILDQNKKKAKNNSIFICIKRNCYKHLYIVRKTFDFEISGENVSTTTTRANNQATKSNN